MVTLRRRVLPRYPDLYSAANVQCVLYDNLKEWQFGLTGLVSYLEPGPPTEIASEYAKDSLLYNSTKVRASTLIFHDSLDFLPFRIAENFHDQLQDNGVAVNLYRFKGEGHGLAVPGSQVSAAQLQIDWFRKYLGPLSPQLAANRMKKP